MMNFEEFKMKIKEEVETLAKEKGITQQLEERVVEKQNSTKVGVGIPIKVEGSYDGENTIEMVFYYVDLYRRYMEGSTTSEILYEIANYMENPPFPTKQMMLNTKSLDLNEIAPILVNREKRKELIKDKPSRSFLDLEILYKQQVFDEKGEAVASFYITDDIARLNNLSENDLYMHSMRWLAKNTNTLEIIPGVIHMSQANDLEFGASALLNNWNIRKMALRLKEKGLYVIPLSICEIVILAESTVSNVKTLKDSLIMMDISGDIPKKEALSNQIYYYNAKENKFSIVA